MRHPEVTIIGAGIAGLLATHADPQLAFSSRCSYGMFTARPARTLPILLHRQR